VTTFQQLVRRKRSLAKGNITSYTRSPKMDGNPQRKGIVQFVGTTKPKKPNSAVRKIAKLKIGKRGAGSVRAVIPGIGHTVKDFDNVLFRAARSRDIPGMHYKIIRGPLNFILPEIIDRKKGRSKYGVKRPKKYVNKVIVSVAQRERLLRMGYRVQDDSKVYVGEYEMYNIWESVDKFVLKDGRVTKV